MHRRSDDRRGGGVDRYVRIWDIETGRLLRSLRGHTADIRALVFTPDGRTLASGSEDRTIRLWEPEKPGSRPSSCLLAMITMCAVCHCPRWPHAMPGSHNKDIKIWEVDRNRSHDASGQGSIRPPLVGLRGLLTGWRAPREWLHDIGKIRIWEVLPSGEEKILHNGHWEETAEDSTETRGFFIEDDGGFQNRWSSGSGR